MEFKLFKSAFIALVCIEVVTLSTRVCCQDNTDTYRDQCRHERLDLVLLFDHAVNTPSYNKQLMNAKWNAMVEFAIHFYESFTVSPDQTHFTMIRYDPNGVSYGSLNSSGNIYPYGMTEPIPVDGRLAFALEVAHNNVLLPGQGARGPGVRKILVFVTDGTDDVSLFSDMSVVDYADQLKSVDATEIFVVTVALNGSDSNLRQIASTPVQSHYLAASLPWQLDGTLNKLLVNMNCSGPAVDTPAVQYMDQCRHEKLDLVVLLDPSMLNTSSSREQLSAKWNYTIDFTVHLHDAFIVSQDLTRFSLMYYTSLVSYVRLNDTGYNFTQDIRNLQTNGPYDVDGSLAFALYVAHNTVLSPGQGSRGLEVRKVLVFITDGTNDLIPFANHSAVDLADKLENVDGVEIFVIPTANISDSTRLRQIASTPVDSHYLAASPLSQLDRTLDALLVNMRCSGPAVLPTNVVKSNSMRTATNTNIYWRALLVIFLVTLHSVTY